MHDYIDDVMVMVTSARMTVMVMMVLMTTVKGRMEVAVV